MSDVEPAGVGDVRLVRTFRVGRDGGLYPVNSPTVWTDGWNHAVCGRRKPHPPPAADCRCGFYAYADTAYTMAQPPARHVLAVVAVNGVLELGSRGARAERARIEALWLDHHISDALARRVRDRYPSVAVFGDRQAMDSAFPLTRLDGFSYPRVSEPDRRRLRVATRLFLVVVVGLGCVPAHTIMANPAGAASWTAALSVAAVITIIGLAQRSAVVGLQGAASVAWLVTADPGTATVDWVMHALLVVIMTTVVVTWWLAAQPGRQVPAPRLERVLRRWRGGLPGSR